MMDEIKAAAERLKQGRTLVRYGTGGPWHGDPHYANDAITVAEAYIAEQAEHHQPISLEWLETLGIKSRESKYYLHSDLLDKADADIVTHTIGDQSTFNFRLHSGCVLTTRGQVLDLLRVLGKEVKS